jgi:chromosome segregation ATPase
MTVFIVMVGLMLAGCGLTTERVVYVDSPPPRNSVPDVEPERVVDPTQQDMQRRFESTAETDDTPVQNAVIWAQKYEELSLRNNELRDQNNKLYLENQRLVRETDKLNMQLEQSQKDLAEANDFLQQMHLELTKWKSDVLGFRDEIRTSQKAQLEALSKILSVLGAEPVTIPDEQADASIDQED